MTIASSVRIDARRSETRSPLRRAQSRNRVNIGAGAKVLGAVQMGDDARIGANAVVLDHVPEAPGRRRAGARSASAGSGDEAPWRANRCGGHRPQRRRATSPLPGLAGRQTGARRLRRFRIDRRQCRERRGPRLRWCASWIRTRPFTAARARNAGFARLLEAAPELELVQFVDGDCEVDSRWLERAERELSADPRARRRVRPPPRAPSGGVDLQPTVRHRVEHARSVTPRHAAATP